MTVVAASHHALLPLERSEGQPAKQAERGDDYCAVEVEVGPHQPHPSLSTPIVNVNKCLLDNTKLTQNSRIIVYIFKICIH